MLSFIDLIHERKLAGRQELAATMETIAAWLSERTGLTVQPCVQTLTATLREAGIITVGGGGIGLPNTYDTTEHSMGEPFGIRWTRSYSFGSIPAVRALRRARNFPHERKFFG